LLASCVLGNAIGKQANTLLIALLAEAPQAPPFGARLTLTPTIDDPTTWTKPWSAIVPLTQIEGPMFEYACSEGNNGIVNMLAGARAAEKAIATRDAKKNSNSRTSAKACSYPGTERPSISALSINRNTPERVQNATGACSHVAVMFAGVIGC